eukprot:Skav206582  [mRNA]  locus=scaffold925:923418:925066:- [translate_table: standard]
MQFLITLVLFGVASAEFSENATSQSRNLQGLVSCGVCKNVYPTACQWCNGKGGPAAVGGSENVVNCGVCRSVPESVCKWCDGTGGPAAVGSSGSSTVSSGGSENVVNCGVCRNVPESTCKTCDGYGGPAAVDSVITSNAGQNFPGFLLLPLAFAAISFA